MIGVFMYRPCGLVAPDEGVELCPYRPSSYPPVVASKKKARARAAAARKYSASAPLVIPGVRWCEERRLRRSRRIAPLLSFWVELVPWFRSTQKGRAAERQMRVGLMLGGLALAMFSGSMGLALLGGVVAMVSTVIPVSEGRKVRWRKQVALLSQPRVIRKPISVELRYDGDSIELYHGEALEQRIEMDHGSNRVYLHTVESRIALEVRPSSGDRSTRIWIVAERDESLVNLITDLPKRDSRKIPSPVTISAREWALLYEEIRT